MAELEQGEFPELISDNEIFHRIWMEPNLVFPILRYHNINRWTSLLIALASCVSVFNRSFTKHLADKYNGIIYIIGILVLSFVITLVFTYLYASMISWTGKWLKGRAGTDSITRVLAYSQIPSASLLLFQIPCLLLFGFDLFKSNLSINHSELVGIFVTSIWYLLAAITSIWSFVLGLIGLAELQNFSLWRSFINYLLPVLIVFGFIIFPIGLFLLLFN
jgi:hypothetical protein